VTANNRSTMGHAVLSREFLKEIPMKPGTYLMKDKSGRVLYVGKARELKRRLASYQKSLGETTTKTGVMLAKVTSIDTILTHTEKEALILEASLIKKHHPRYNVILRDDKNYPYLKVTVAEQWPRLLMSRRRTNDGSRYFGPYSSGLALRDTLLYLNKLFPLRRCNTRELRMRTRPCLNQQMGRCPGPCAGPVDSKKYREMVGDLLLALEGRNRRLLQELTSRMTQASESLEFETAARCRDQIRAISKTLERQVVVAAHFKDQDVFGLTRQQGTAAVSVLFVREGVINGQLSFFLPEALESDSILLTEVVERFYGDGQPVPPEIVLPFAPEGAELLAEWLSDLKGTTRVRIEIPRRGEGVRLVSMAVENARQVLLEKINQGQAWDTLAAGIMHELQLAGLPGRVECLDISNIGGELAVGSLVCFIDGQPEKRGYRHYRIHQVKGPDDYAMMSEVLTRRFAEPAGSAILPCPDLLVLDGGKGQLNVGLSVLATLGKEKGPELVAIAKGGEGENDRLFRPGRKNPIVLPLHSPVLLYCMRIRDEAHRFGITFHRRLRGKNTLQSVLDRVPGIGPIKKKALLIKFGSIKKVREATVAELEEVSGIGKELALEIKKIFV